MLSIGLGYVAHIMRRGVNMAYIVENNGVCGLTKGQFSAAADRGSRCKEGVACAENAVDLQQADGGVLRLRKLRDDFDPTDPLAGLQLVHSLQAKDEVATGLLCAESGAADLDAVLQTCATRLNRLADAALCPGAAVLAPLNASLR